MKRTLKAAAAAVFVSTALIASPAAAAEAPNSVLPGTYQVQPKTSTGGMSTMGAGTGAPVFWCLTFGLFC